MIEQFSLFKYPFCAIHTFTEFTMTHAVSRSRINNVYEIANEGQGKKIREQAKGMGLLVSSEDLELMESGHYSIRKQITLREKVKALSNYPLGEKEPCAEEQTLGYGGFILTGPDIGLVSNHLLTKPFTGIDRELIKKTFVVFNFYRTELEQSNREILEKWDLYKITEVVEQNYYRGSDWMIVKLDRRVRHGVPFLLNSSTSDDFLSSSAKYHLWSFPGGVCLKYHPEVKLMTDAKTDKTIDCELFTIGDCTGGALVHSDSGRVVGMVNRLERRYYIEDINYNQSQHTRMKIPEKRQIRCQRIDEINFEYIDFRLHRIVPYVCHLEPTDQTFRYAPGLNIEMRCDNQHCSLYQPKWVQFGFNEYRHTTYTRKLMTMKCNQCFNTTIQITTLGLYDCRFHIKGKKSDKDVNLESITLGRYIHTLEDLNESPLWTYLEITTEPKEEI